jgi:hypothetical protein
LLQLPGRSDMKIGFYFRQMLRGREVVVVVVVAAAANVVAAHELANIAKDGTILFIL